MGSIVNYKPPAETKTVIYEYSTHGYSASNAGGISNFQFKLGGTLPNYYDLDYSSANYSLVGAHQAESTSGTDLEVTRQAVRLGEGTDVQDTINVRAIIHITGKKSTLSVDINDSVNTIILASTDNFPVPASGGVNYISIGEEIISYGGVTGNNLTNCVRGVNESISDAHDAPAVVSYDDVANGQIGSWDTQRKMKVTARDYSSYADLAINRQDDFQPADGLPSVSSNRDRRPKVPVIKITAQKGPSISYPS